MNNNLPVNSIICWKTGNKDGCSATDNIPPNTYFRITSICHEYGIPIILSEPLYRMVVCSKNGKSQNKPKKVIWFVDGITDQIEKGNIEVILKGKTMSSQFFRKYVDMLKEDVDVKQVADNLEFKPTTKKAIKYGFCKDCDPTELQSFTYSISTKQQPIITITNDGKETENVAMIGDIIISGPSRELYVIKPAKFGKLYSGNIGGTVIPEQSPRQVAHYTAPETISFTASWGESMICKQGDYLVKDGDNYYRIAKAEYEQTYNQPGK